MPTSRPRGNLRRQSLKAILEHVALAIVSILVVYSVTFLVFELIPGRFYDTDVARDDQVIHNIVTKYGLNESMGSRYIRGLSDLLSFNLGYSYVESGRPVGDIVKQHAPLSFLIGIISLSAAVTVGVLWSIYLFQRKTLRIMFDVVGLMILSSPIFVIAILLQYFIGVRLGWLPVYGVTYASSYILPVLTLSITPAVLIAQVLMSDMRKISSSMYVQAARARGTSSNTILFEYILKNSLTATLTYLAPIAAAILAGSFVVESIFNIPGLGRYFVTAITNRDYPTILGLTLFYSILIITINTAASIFVGILNRRYSSVDLLPRGKKSHE